MDDDSDAPISGAFIVFEWHSIVPRMHSSPPCTHIAISTSNADGFFEAQSATNYGAYRRGYEETYHHALGYYRNEANEWIVYSAKKPDAPKQAYASESQARVAAHANDVYLKRFSGTREERFRYIQRRVFGGMTTCFEGGQSSRNVYPLLKAALEEATSLAITDEQRASVRRMRDAAANAWLGSSVERPLFQVPREICLELGGSEELERRQTLTTGHADGSRETKVMTWLEEPPCK